jgi:hypothetical protein
MFNLALDDPVTCSEVLKFDLGQLISINFYCLKPTYVIPLSVHVWFSWFTHVTPSQCLSL